MAKILIVEDDITFGQMLKTWLSKKGYTVQLCSTVTAAQTAICQERFDMVITDLRLPDSDGILLLQWIKDHHAQLAVIIMTSYADINSAVSAIKLGAQDYMEKPIRPDELNQKIMAALDLSNKTAVKPSKKSTPFIAGSDVASQKLYEHMQLIAPTNMSVLITGESGTGKEYVAKFIHKASKIANRSFVAVDCGAISRELGASELFGHKKGAFTSAISDKIGLFEQANGGTIFLDEIGNLTPEIQMQLLRALQERKIRPVGSPKEIEVDVRVLSATNENLLSAIAEGRFREDLYHRINEFSLHVPPLRARGGDIMLFARNFLEQACGELEKRVTDFSIEVEYVFTNYHWSGNLRQMRNIVKRAVLFSKGEIIETLDLPEEMTRMEEPNSGITPLKRDNEKELIMQALAKCSNNKSKTARLLNIDRKTLYNKLKLWDIEL